MESQKENSILSTEPNKFNAEISNCYDSISLVLKALPTVLSEALSLTQLPPLVLLESTSESVKNSLPELEIATLETVKEANPAPAPETLKLNSPKVKNEDPAEIDRNLFELIGKNGYNIVDGCDIPNTFLIGRIGNIGNYEFKVTFTGAPLSKYTTTNDNYDDYYDDDDDDDGDDYEEDYYKSDLEYKDEKINYFGYYKHYEGEIISWNFRNTKDKTIYSVRCNTGRVTKSKEEEGEEGSCGERSDHYGHYCRCDLPKRKSFDYLRFDWHLRCTDSTKDPTEFCKWLLMEFSHKLGREIRNRLAIEKYLTIHV